MDQQGQSTVEYALILLGAAAIALALVSWVTGSNVVGRLFDTVIDRILGRAVTRHRSARGQATVEVALVLPVVVVVLAVLVQVGLLVRDRIVVVHAARAAARAVAVDPSSAAAAAALSTQPGVASDATVSVGGDPRPGGLVTGHGLRRARPGCRLVGYLVSGVELREQLSARVEERPATGAVIKKPGRDPGRGRRRGRPPWPGWSR